MSSIYDFLNLVWHTDKTSSSEMVAKLWLTHWERHKITAISQTTFSNTLSWMKIFEFRLRFRWSLFLGYELTIFQHLNLWWLVYWRIYASLGLNGLKPSQQPSQWWKCHHIQSSANHTITSNSGDCNVLILKVCQACFTLLEDWLVCK